MEIKLSDHFDYKKLFKFTIPSVGMMVFVSIYGIVDGFFVSNFCGKTAFASINFILPFVMILGSIGLMFGTGSSALISKTLGEGNTEKANKIFTMVVFVSFVIGVIISVLGILLIRPLTIFLGAEKQMIDICVQYGTIIIITIPFFIIQNEFQALFITNEKPRLGFKVTLIAGITNMVGDFLLVYVFKTGVIGAAIATSASQFVGGIIPILYFIFSKNNILKFTTLSFDMRALIKTCTNGSSEFVSNISMSIVSMLYNYQLIKYYGEDGVSAYGTFMYVGFIFVAIFIGYSIGVAPVIGYNYGATNTKELQNIFKKSIRIIIVSSFILVVLSQVLADPLSRLYVGYDISLFKVTSLCLHISSISFLFLGIGIFSSSLFTALNNGLISAVLSFLRNIILQVIFVFLLPLIFGGSGIWYSIIVSEFIAIVVCIIIIVHKRKEYNYY